MFIHTLESLEEFEDYIKQLEETVGLSTETYQDVKKAISKERDKLKNLSLSDVSESDLDLLPEGACPVCKKNPCENEGLGYPEDDED